MSNTHATIIGRYRQTGICAKNPDLAAKSAAVTQDEMAVLSRISYADFNFS